MKTFKKNILKKVAIRISATLILSFGILIIAVLYPSFMYAKATPINDKITVYSNQSISSELESVIQQGYTMIQDSEIYDSAFEIKVCLNDGSAYPGLIRTLRGEAFAYGFAHNTVVAVDIFPKENYAIWKGRKRLLTELFAHEFIHNFQYNSYGFSTLSFPFWKLEGYPEYVMTRINLDADFKKDIEILLDAETKGLQDWDWIEYEDGFGTTPIYLRSRLLTQFLIEVKGLTYDDIIKDESLIEIQVKNEMLDWYKNN